MTPPNNQLLKNDLEPIFQTELKSPHHIPPTLKPQKYASSLPKLQPIRSHIFDTTQSIPELQLCLPIINSHKFSSNDEKKRVQKYSSEVRDYTMEHWLHTTKRFPNGRWSIKERRTLWNLFISIDEDGSGEVDIEELADPLLSSGIAKTMGEVRALVRSVDENNSGSIGFIEFLRIMRPKQTNKNDFVNDTSNDSTTRRRSSEFSSLRTSNLSRNYNAFMKGKRGMDSQTSRRLSSMSSSDYNKDTWFHNMTVFIKKHGKQPKTKKQFYNLSSNHANFHGRGTNNKIDDPHRKPLETGTTNNPIVRLQKMQKQNGNMDMKSVLTVKRRKLLLDATMGEAQRRESALEDIGMWKMELKKLHGTARFRKMYKIQSVAKKLAKTQGEKQHFVSAMQGMIEKELGSPEESKHILSRRSSLSWNDNEESKMETSRENRLETIKMLGGMTKKYDVGYGRNALLLPSTSKKNISGT